MFNGLSSVNIELTSQCNKGDGTPGSGCWMCGRRKLEREYPELCKWDHMPLEMIHTIQAQLPPGITVQLHNNGDPLCYPKYSLDIAIMGFMAQFTGLNTNAKLLLDKASEITTLNSITLSIIQNDPEGEEQLLIIQSYLELEIKKPPIIVFRMLGEIDKARMDAYTMLAKEHNCLVVHRQLHAPEGSFNYEKRVTIPEMGICLEMLHKLSIDREGNVSPCVRFDPKGEHRIGNITEEPLKQIWSGQKRAVMLKHHLNGERYKASPVCAQCSFWGVPSA